MKIELAPLSVPLQRRLQTASVAQWVFSFLGLAQCCTVAFIALFFTRFWLVSALYAAWWFIDREKPNKGGRRIHAIRNSVVWRYMRDYFPITVSATDPIGSANHSRVGFTDAHFFLPLCPPGLVSSDKESASYVLQKLEGGNMLTIVVGGAQEALDARPGSCTLLLKNRKGFVRLAIEHGTPLVPIFSFGENDLFEQVRNPKGSWLRQLQHRLQQIMGISLPIFYARGIFQYSFGLVPYRRPICTVVGKPIPVQRKHRPSEEEVDQVHQKYLDELCKLFEEHKAKYNIPEDRHLEFI
ncbi:2-acylglycerol O-acyltransferase 2, partial [Eudyptes chrysocome]